MLCLDNDGSQDDGDDDEKDDSNDDGKDDREDFDDGRQVAGLNLFILHFIINMHVFTSHAHTCNYIVGLGGILSDASSLSLSLSNLGALHPMVAD